MAKTPAIAWVCPVCGYIHRMQEKMGENRTYAQFLPNTSRIDYLSDGLFHEEALLSIEEIHRGESTRAQVGLQRVAS